MTMRRSIQWLAFALLACNPAGSARADEPGKTLEGWGTAFDPDGDCKFRLEKRKLTIEVPGTLHDFAAEFHEVNAPRVVREVAGDFVARVKVAGAIRPGGQRTSRHFVMYQGAGLFVAGDWENYVRLERAAVNTRGEFIPYINFDRRKDGENLGNQERRVPDQPIFLRLERRGGQLLGATSPDGDHWEEFKPLDVDLPAKVKIGVDAVNTSSAMLEAELEGFAVTEVAPVGKPD